MFEGIRYAVLFLCLSFATLLPEKLRIKVGKWLLKIKHEEDA